MFNEMLRSHTYTKEWMLLEMYENVLLGEGERERRKHGNICFDLDLFLFLLFLSIVRSFIHNNQ